MPDYTVEKVWRYVHSFRYQSVTDRRTDGFAITVSRSVCMGMLMRDDDDDDDDDDDNNNNNN